MMSLAGPCFGLRINTDIPLAVGTFRQQDNVVHDLLLDVPVHSQDERAYRFVALWFGKGTQRVSRHCTKLAVALLGNKESSRSDPVPTYFQFIYGR